ncbi:MAG: prephenate dehydrogenase [Thermoleophilia bacterium]
MNELSPATQPPLPGREPRPEDQTRYRVRRLAVLGVGLMGGSFALAARRHAEVEEVVGYDRDSAAVEQALAAGVLTAGAEHPEEAAAGADLALVAVPVRAIPSLVEAAAATDEPPSVITDVGSTKSAITRGLSPQAAERFVGGHPMCGAETSGVRFAREDLFTGATYFLTPSDRIRPAAYEMLRGLVTAVGARPIRIDPEDHDQIMARVSHLPHVLANVLMCQVGSFEAGGRRALHSVGPSFKDLTRVAGTNPRMWRDIFRENREALLNCLEEIQQELDDFARRLREDDADSLTGAIYDARRYRQELLQLEDLVPDMLYRVVARIPDQPGVLSRVTTALAAARINVEDLTLHHFSRDAGGDLVLFVQGEEAAGAAADMLEDLGYPTVVGSPGGDRDA